MKMLQVTLPEESDFGPAMLALDDRRKGFVLALVANGGNAWKAAKASGWCQGSDVAARVQGYRLIREPGILKALREEADRQLDSGVYIAVAGLVEIAADKEHKDRYKACADIMDRRGFMRVTGQAITVEDKRTDSELLEFIRATALKHKLDPRLLLGSDASIEATAKDITPKEPAKRGGVKRGRAKRAVSDGSGKPAAGKPDEVP